MDQGSTCAMCASMEGGVARNASSDPVEMGVMIWQKAFFKAHLEFMAEKLKKKIEAAWGPTADKAADAMIRENGKPMARYDTTNTSRADLPGEIDENFTLEGEKKQ